MRSHALGAPSAQRSATRGGHVDQESDRPLRQRLDDRGGRGDDHVGRRRAETIDEKSTNPGLLSASTTRPGISAGTRARWSVWPAAATQRPTAPEARANPLRWIGSTSLGCTGPVVRKALVAGVVCLLDVLDDRDEIVEFDRVGIEQDHRPSNDGVDLGPVHALEALECVLEVTEHRRVKRIADAAHLNVSPAAGDGGVPLPAPLSVAEPRGQTANRGQRVEPDRK